MDFSLQTYLKLINSLYNRDYSFKSFAGYLNNPGTKTIILRHDVDRLPANSLFLAKIQNEYGLKGSYYFRLVSQSFNEKIIREIYEMGHEVGYHYEDLSFAEAKVKAQGAGHRAQGEELEKQLVVIGIESFKINLERLRSIVPVKTICMHGSPLSRWDSRLLWKYYDYRDFGIIGEPYFAVDFDEMMYLTDTGRRWDGDSVNIRDKAHGLDFMAQGSILRKASDGKAGHMAQGKSNRLPITDYRLPFPKFHSTFDIILAAEEGKLPDKIMMTFHPQRWTDKPLPWAKELLLQNLKNGAKYFLLKVRNGMN